MTAIASHMARSPLDASPHAPANLVRLKYVPRDEWVPSRFNARAVAEDGRVVLWNTYTTAISVFETKHRPMLDQYLSQKGFGGKLNGLSQYLFDRGYLIAKGTDEFRRFRSLFGQQHYRTDTLELILLSSEDCNFRCTYCYEDFKRGTMLPEVRAGVKNLVRKRAPQLRVLNTGWFGGEPLYGIEAVRDLGPFFVEVAREHGLAHGSNMTTNGYLLTPDIAEEVLSYNIRQFQITLDGPAETHDRKRKGRDGEQTFQRIHDNLISLSKREDNYVVSIRVNYDQENYPRLEEFIGLMERDFANDPRFQLRFRPVGKWGGANDEELAICGTDIQRDVQRRVSMIAKEKGLSVADGIREINRPGRYVCYAARPYNFIVGADGKLMKCTIVLDNQENNIVGQLTPEGETLLNHDHMALWTQPAFEDDATCRSCYILPTCQGLACPLARMDTGQRSCCATKSNLKHDLLSVLDTPQPSQRAVTVR